VLAAVLDKQRGALLLWAPVAFSCGIASYFGLKVEPSVLPMALAVALAALGVATLWRFQALRALAVLVALGLSGGLVAKLQTDVVAAPILNADYRGPVMGRLVGLDRSERNQLRLWLDEVELFGDYTGPVPERVRVVLAQAPPEGIIFAGARVMVGARLGPPPPPVEPDGFDFRRHAWFLRLGAIGYAPDPVVLASPRGPTPPDLILLNWRLTLAQALRDRMPGRPGGFAAAILTGDRSGVDPADLVDLRASNLAHLLAISGLHMGLLCGAVFAAARLLLIVIPRVGMRLPAKKIAAVVALLAGAGYLALSGASIATQRAFVMAAVVFVAIILDRPALTLRAVAMAALIVLILRPVALMGPGFQMSFAATIALIATYSALKDWRPWMEARGLKGALIRFLGGLVMTSAVAGLATAPFSAFHFNQVTRYGLLANVLAVPAMGLMVMPAGLVALLLWPLGLEAAPLAVMQFGIEHILSVAHWAATLDGAVSPVATGPWWVPGAVAIGGVILAAVRGRLRLVGVAPIAAALLAWGGSTRPDVLVSPEGRLVGVLGAEGRALSTSRGQGFAARVWLENDGDQIVQATAAKREGQVPVVIWTADRILPSGDCKRDVLVVAPKLETGPVGPCVFLGAAALRYGGAHAFFADKLSTPRTTRAATGLRPWTLPTDRQERGQ